MSAKILTIEPGLEPYAVADILLAVQETWASNARYKYDRPRIRGLSGGQLAVYAGGLRP